MAAGKRLKRHEGQHSLTYMHACPADLALHVRTYQVGVGGHVKQGGATPPVVQVHLADVVLLRMAGHLRGRACGHMVPRDAAPVALCSSEGQAGLRSPRPKNRRPAGAIFGEIGPSWGAPCPGSSGLRGNSCARLRSMAGLHMASRHRDCLNSAPWGAVSVGTTHRPLRSSAPTMKCLLACYPALLQPTQLTRVEAQKVQHGASLYA